MALARWFEIPVAQLDRAKAFYEKLLDIEIIHLDMTAETGSKMGMFPDEDGVGGALVQNAEHGYVPSHEGALVYFSVTSDLEKLLGKVEGEGGQILLPKTSIGENGYIAWLQDSEGNRIGLHSMG